MIFEILIDFNIKLDFIVIDNPNINEINSIV